MSDTETKTVRVRAVRDFKDAGTERHFAKGKTFDLTEGEVANYLAAGLVEPDEALAADASETPTKGSKRS